MKAKKTVCIYWLILVVVFGCIIGARSTEIKVEAAERTVRFWEWKLSSEIWRELVFERF